MPLYPPMCTHKGWDTGQGLRLKTGLTNSNKTGSRSQNPKAQKIAVGRKNTQCLQCPPPPPSSFPGIHSLLSPRKVPKPLLCEESTENTCPGYWLLLASLAVSLPPFQPLTTCGVQQDVCWVVGFQAQSRQGCLGQTWRRAHCVERRGGDSGSEVTS